ncbi:hypothetical protein ACOSP7_002248 [Xanthoceras sorbifolium]
MVVVVTGSLVTPAGFAELLKPNPAEVVAHNPREIAKSNWSFSEFRRRHRRKKCFFDVKWNLRAVKHSSMSFLLDVMYSTRLFWGQGLQCET